MARGWRQCSGGMRMSGVFGGQWGHVHLWLVLSEVSDRAIRLYALLDAKYANKDDRAVFPSHSTLAEIMLCSSDSVARALRELEKVGAVEVQARYRSDGSRTSNAVFLIAHLRDDPRDRADPLPQPSGGDPAPVREQEETRSIEPDPSNQTKLSTVVPLVVDDAFEAFWKVFPRHEDKKKARAAWPKALKVADAGTLTVEAARYAVRMRRERREPSKVLHATTWLNGERWNDEAPAIRDGASFRGRLNAPVNPDYAGQEGRIEL